MHDLKAQFTHLRAFSKDDFLSRHVVALEIEGPEHSDFSKLAAAICVLVREELERYQENHPA